MANSQPRCPGCYSLEGLEARAGYTGENAVSKQAKLNLIFNSDKSELNIVMDRKKSNPSTPGHIQFVEMPGCYSVTKATVTPPKKGNMADLLKATDRYCIKDTRIAGRVSRSGSHSVEFFAKGKLINTLGFNLATIQPRCPNCYSLEGLSGTASFTATIEEVQKITFATIFKSDKSMLSLVGTKLPTAD
jgi:hypothetical protein